MTCQSNYSTSQLHKQMQQLSLITKATKSTSIGRSTRTRSASWTDATVGKMGRWKLGAKFNHRPYDQLDAEFEDLKIWKTPPFSSGVLQTRINCIHLRRPSKIIKAFKYMAHAIYCSALLGLLHGNCNCSVNSAYHSVEIIILCRCLCDFEYASVFGDRKNLVRHFHTHHL